MATRLSWWLGGTVLACALVAVGYLPPRGLGTIGNFIGVISPWREPKRSAARARAGELESQWRQVDGQLQASYFRREAEQELQARRSRGEQGPLLIVAPDSASARKREILSVALDSAWRQLDLRDAKVDLIVAIPSRTARTEAGGPDRFNYTSRTYLLPDSTDRTTCLVVLPMFWHERYRKAEMARWVRGSLGPCAFYAKFGAPGPRVRHWLDANQFDVAESSEWSNSHIQVDDYFGFGDDYSPTWKFLSYYAMPFNTVACLGARLDACTRAIRNGDSDRGGPVSRVVIPSNGWRLSGARIVNQQNFLASIYKQVGENPFQEFWTTTLPVDSALTIALEQPVAEWSTRWQMEGRPHLQLGADAPPLSAVLFATIIAVIAVVLVCYASRWRQVR